MGMRGTGSETIQFENVFVPEEAISLTRKKGEFHPFWNVVLGAAMPLIMSAYVGLAQKAFNLSISAARKKQSQNIDLSSALGHIFNQVTTMEVMWQDMLKIGNNLDFEPKNEISSKILTRKTTVANLAMNIVNDALNIIGGSGFYKNHTIERIFRDVQAARFHPMQEAEQVAWTGKQLLIENN